MTKHKVFQIAAIWILLIVIFTPINLLFPFGAALKYAIFMGMSLLLFPKMIAKGSMVALLLYTLETFVYYSIGNAYFGAINDVVVPFLTMGSALILIEYTFQYDNDFKFTRTALWVSILATLGISLISIPVLRVNPEIIRIAYSMSDLEDREVVSASSWIISWGNINGITYLIATIVFLCRKVYSDNKKMFFFWLFTLIVFYYIVFRSNIATPFILSTIMLLLGFWFVDEKFNQKVIMRMVSIGLVVSIMLTPAVVVPVISVLQQQIGPGSTYKRLEEVKETFVYGETTGGDMEGRNDLYKQSWDLFVESPLIGTMTPERISHHSFMLDRLACHGIIFIIPLFLVFIIHFRSIYKKLTHTKVTYMLGLFAFVFLLFYKGASDTNYLFGFFILPLLCRYIDGIIDCRYNKVINNC